MIVNLPKFTQPKFVFEHRAEVKFGKHTFAKISLQQYFPRKVVNIIICGRILYGTKRGWKTIQELALFVGTTSANHQTYIDHSLHGIL